MTDNPKTISKEAAKLLGLPFKWAWSVPMKFARTADGYRLLTWREGTWVDENDRSTMFEALCTHYGGLPHVTEVSDDRQT